MTKRYALRNDQCEHNKDLLPQGIPWRDLPERFSDFRAVHTRFSCWTKTGRWQRSFEVLPHDCDNEYAC